MDINIGDIVKIKTKSNLVFRGEITQKIDVGIWLKENNEVGSLIFTDDIKTINKINEIPPVQKRKNKRDKVHKNLDFDNYKLKIDWKPGMFHYQTVRKNITESLWKKIRLEILDQKNYCCSICGFIPEDKNDYKKLHVHEIEEYENEELICTLKELDLVCKKCHSFYHFGRTSSVLNEQQMNELIEHFTKVNDCSEDDFREYYKIIRTEKLKWMKISPIKRDSLRDKVVKFTILGDIPYKEDVIDQLKKKGLYKC